MSDASGGDRPGEATDRCERTSLAGRRCVLRTGHREFGQLDCDFFGEDRPSDAPTLTEWACETANAFVKDMEEREIVTREEAESDALRYHLALLLKRTKGGT